MSRALVTGGSRGIGAAIATELVNAGHEVFTCSRFTPQTSVGRWIASDLTSDLDRLILRNRIGKMDIVISNCGGGGRHGTDEDVFAKNFIAMQELTEDSLPEMVRNGWGRVIAIGSIYGHREVGAPRPIFHAAKAAQAAWMKAMSKDMRYVRSGITFNTVCPGNVRVAGKPDVDESLLPMGRMGTPDEVGKLVAFLCSVDAAWINGSCINIDGGESNAI